MVIKKDQTQKEILILNDYNVIVSKLFFIPSFFLWILYTKDPVVITKDTDEVFYNNLNWLMNNSYEFSHNYSKKTGDELIWFSEQCYDIENEEKRDMVSRLIIKKANDEFHISYSNPFFEKNNINHKGTISFSPCGDGFGSKNINTGATLQDDIVNVFYNTLCEKSIEVPKLLTKSLEHSQK